MKIRSGFVSNSSSSSFIFWQTPLIEHFKLEKKDIFDALVSLYGKDKYDAWVKDHTYDAGQAKIAKRRAELEKEGNGKIDEEALKWEEEYYTSKDFLGLCPFYIYDLMDEKDMAAAEEKFGGLLSGWDQRYAYAGEDQLDFDRTGENIEKFSGFLASINGVYDTYLHQGTERELAWTHVSGSNYDLYHKLIKIPLVGYWLGEKIALKSLPKSIKKLVLNARESLGIMTNLDVLQDECTRFFIHFEDNEMGELLGMNTRGKNDDFGDGGDSTLETEVYSCSRFMEILLREWIKNGRINIQDKDFLKRYPWHNNGSVVWLPDGKYGVNSFIKETVATCNGHEG